MNIKNPDLINLKEKLILEEAEKHGVTWEQLEGTRMFRLTYKEQQKCFYGGFPTSLTHLAYLACLDKRLTRFFLQDKNLPIPPGLHFSSSDDLELIKQSFSKLNKPLVVKASHSNNGECVITNITDESSFEAAVKKALSMCQTSEQGIVVEEQVQGTDYRITLDRNKVIAILTRIPANVVGDGVHTITELIAEKNKDPLRQIDPVHADPYAQITVDELMEAKLSDQGLKVSDIPKAGQTVVLRYLSNLAQGGDGVDVTDQVHQSVKDLALQALAAIPDLPFAGLDFMTTDVTQDQKNVEHHFIEVNAGPSYSMHHYPMKGTARNVAFELLAMMFPELKNDSN